MNDETLSPKQMDAADEMVAAHDAAVFQREHAAGLARAAADVKVVSTIRASNAEFDCPHCGAEVIGWISDPRGAEETCETCHRPYKVAADAAVRIG